MRAVVTVDDATGVETTTPARTVDPRAGPGTARRAGADGRRGAAHRGRRRGRGVAAPTPADRGRRLPVHGHDRRGPRRRVVEGLHRSSSCSSARARPCLGTCQGGACLPHVRSWIAARTGDVPAAVHGPPGLAPDHARRGGRGHLRRRLPADAAARRAPRARAPGWTGSAAGGGRGTTATRSPSTGPSARASRSATSARSASSSSPGRTSSRPWSGSTRATSRTSSPAARATRCCSTSAATSWTTG